jgi:hypothetical protein
MLLYLQWSYIPINPSQTENTANRKMPLTQLTYQTSQFNSIVYCKVTVKYWLFLVISELTGTVAQGHCPASRENIGSHMTSPGKDHNSKFKVQFPLNIYHFHTIVKSKKYNLETVLNLKFLFL